MVAEHIMSERSWEKGILFMLWLLSFSMEGWHFVCLLGRNLGPEEKQSADATEEAKARHGDRESWGCTQLYHLFIL